MRAARIDLRATIDTLPTLHWRCLPDGSAEFLNQTWLDYTGYSMEQGCGWDGKVHYIRMIYLY